MENISVDQLKKRMDAGEEVNLLDVREDSERKEFNIGGTHLPLGNIVSMQTDSIEDLKDKELIVYCRSGNRSMQAASFLEMMGFKNVKNLAGGMLAWQKEVG